MRSHVSLSIAVPALVFALGLAGCEDGAESRPASPPASGDSATEAPSGEKPLGSSTKKVEESKAGGSSSVDATKQNGKAGESGGKEESPGGNEGSADGDGAPEGKTGEKEDAASSGEASAQGGDLARAYFASGCFWCVEAIYESCRGVKESISGYSGGHTKNPTYAETNTGTTGHAEAVKILYDPETISFETLVDVYFGSQDVTQVNGQGPDRGSQYRSILFYQNERQKRIIEAKIAEVNGQLGDEKVAAEVMPFEKFWKAEDYHQDYEEKHPNDRYIRAVSIPRLERFKEKFPELLKESAGH